MSRVTAEYVSKLPPIYKDILGAFAEVEPRRRRGWGLAYQSIYSGLEGRYPLGQIQLACEEMAKNDVVQIRNRIFVHPTDLGEQMIEELTGEKVPAEQVPAFPPLRARR